MAHNLEAAFRPHPGAGKRLSSFRSGAVRGGQVLGALSFADTDSKTPISLL